MEDFLQKYHYEYIKNCTNEKKANERNILFYDSELFYDYSHLKPELGNKILRDMRIMEKL